jgi:hypothetical protein
MLTVLRVDMMTTAWASVPVPTPVTDKRLLPGTSA